MSAGLFTTALAQLDPDRMLRTECGPLLSARTSAGATPPSNKEVLQAAQASYQAHYPVVDGFTTGGISYVGSTGGRPEVATLNAYDWQSRQAGPITPTALAVHQAGDFAAAQSAAQSDGTLMSLCFGISESAQAIIGEEAGIGVAFALGDAGTSVGTAYAAGKLGLDIDVGLNLNVALWTGSPQQLAGTFYGIEVNLDLEVGVCLGVYVGGGLQTFGFSIGLGVGLGGGATIVGGYTWVF